MSTPRPYIGRFAPSPSGPLHMGSLVAALASYLDARLHQGQWLVRIEDIDETRSVAGADQHILHSLQALGLYWDGEVVWQSRRKHLYSQAYQQLQAHTYACTCSRREIADSARRLGLGPAADGATIYPGTCRPPGMQQGRQSGELSTAIGTEVVEAVSPALPARHARTLRLCVPAPGQTITYQDRRMGSMQQDLGREVGDFVLQRADGFWSYQMAVVVDDWAQQITHVVRGEDLIDSTARQVYLHQLLRQTPPQWLHVGVVRNPDGEKLSKQNGAQALDLSQPLATLHQAAALLQLDLPACADVGHDVAHDVAQFLAGAIRAWERKLLQWEGGQ